MVQAPGPIHSDVRLLLIQFHSTRWVWENEHKTVSKLFSPFPQEAQETQ